jgi:hypothetical protein
MEIFMPVPPAVAEIETLLRQWAKSVNETIGCDGAFVFGSLIYKSGVQFNPMTSDVDLVIGIPEAATDAPSRAKWILDFLTHKQQLELSLMTLLKRPKANDPICSVVAVTQAELRSDIHKDGAAGFFGTNAFRNLLREGAADGALAAGTNPITNNHVRSALQFAQKYRNIFLGVSANGTGKLLPWTGDDPVPKDVMRHAARAAAARLQQGEPGAEFDVKIGLDFLSEHLYTRRDQSRYYYRLHDWVSGRRGGKGSDDSVNHLPPEMYLLLAEVIYDLGIEAVVRELTPESRPIVELQIHESVSEGALVLTAALPARFVVTDEFALQGSIEEIEATLDEATHNLKWRLEPAFKIEFAQNAATLATLGAQAKMSYRERKLLAESRDKQLHLVTRGPIVERGFRLVLQYQYLLFRDGSRLSKHLIVALNSYLRRVRLTPHHSIGGLFQAYIRLGEHHKFVVGFSLDDKATKALFARCGFTDVLELAADNQPLTQIQESALARHFVPELVFDFIAKTKESAPSAQEEREIEEVVFNLSLWDVGIC